jgi:hypothetical protein
MLRLPVAIVSLLMPRAPPLGCVAACHARSLDPGAGGGRKGGGEGKGKQRGGKRGRERGRKKVRERTGKRKESRKRKEHTIHMKKMKIDKRRENNTNPKSSVRVNNIPQHSTHV